MNNELIRNHYDAFLRIEAFHIKYGASFPAGGRAGSLFAAMAGLVAELDHLGVGQLKGATDYHASTSAKQQAAEQLRSRLRRLRDTARAIAGVDRNPRLAAPFVVPRSRGFTPLLTQAKLALMEARPLEARLTEFEMPAGFLDSFETEISQFELTVDDQDAGLSTQVGGTAGTVVGVDRGVELRKQLLPLVRNRFQDNPSILAEWESAARIVRVKRKPVAKASTQGTSSAG